MKCGRTTLGVLTLGLGLLAGCEPCGTFDPYKKKSCDPDSTDPSDFLVIDLAPPAADLARPDLLALDLAPRGPCRQEGIELADGVWACRGDFEVGDAGDLCRDMSYHICASEDRLEIGDSCEEVEGFYASGISVERVELYDASSYQIDCYIGMTVDPTWGLIGCGREDRILGKKVRSDGGSCPSLPHVMRCGETTTWQCRSDSRNAGRLLGMSHVDSDIRGGGVLCCRTNS